MEVKIMKKKYIPAEMEMITIGDDDIVRTSAGIADNIGHSPFGYIQSDVQEDDSPLV